MKRFLAILLVMVLVIGVFASCGSSVEEEGSDTVESGEATDGVLENDKQGDSGDETPGDETPGDETPGDETPGDETPGDETPGDETPGDETPGDETPGEEPAHTHSGGTATCQAAAVCTTCNQPYGEKNASNHTGTEEWVDTQNPNTHKKAYSCCGAVTVAETAHTGGTATCKAAAVCTVCEQAYGSIDPNAHGALVDTWVKKNESTHAKYYECGHEAQTGSHSAETAANCQDPAHCAVCDSDYGRTNSSVHTGTVSDWTYVNENGHVKTYGCGHIAESGEHYGGTATCQDKAVCEGCNTAYGSIDTTNHKVSEEKDWIKTPTGHREVCAHCNAVIDAVEEEHTIVSGECTVCGYNPETAASCSHTGGEANCQYGAICINCGTEYSEVNPNNHAGTPGDWEYFDETYHVQKYSCCGVEASRVEHEGGTATCQNEAVCGGCNYKYGEKNVNNHIGEPGAWTYVDDDTCAKYYSECGCVAESGEHDGTATCQDKAVCSKCDNEHGALDPDNHVGEVTGWIDDGNDHVKRYSGCGHDAERGAHTGGTATCQTLAECGVCHLPYGEIAYHAWETTLSDLEDGYHGYKCTTIGCNEVNGKTAHDFTGDGECDCGATCPHDLDAHETCSVCHVSAGHIYKDGVCTSAECGIKIDGIAVGDTVTFGSYYQSNNDTDQSPIKWTVLEVKDGKALILADKILDYSNYVGVSAWLTDFKNNFFTDTQKQIIDEVFLLSKAQLQNADYGFDTAEGISDTDETGMDPKRVKAPTDYVLYKNPSFYADGVTGGGSWWTSTAYSDSMQYRVKPKGQTYHYQNNTTMICGIVPAMWISIEGYCEDHAYGIDNVCDICEYVCEHELELHEVCEECKVMQHNYTTTAGVTTCSGCGVSFEGKKIGDTVVFGSYPQTQVNDSTLTAALNNAASGKTWTNYEYDGCDMSYIDITYNGAKYRGVKITSFRPSGADGSFYQQNNGFATGNTYWFKFEPISWTIIKAEGSNVLVLCDLIIDSQRFDADNHDYEESEIRAWLLDDFYNTAFAELQQGVILAMDIDLDEDGTDDAQDKVFLLTYEEALALDSYTKTSTDYAKVQGTLVTTKAGFEGNGQWILRTPGTTSEYPIYRMTPDGLTGKTADCRVTTTGIVPAMWIKL